jgi:hypothetical protein
VGRPKTASGWHIPDTPWLGLPHGDASSSQEKRLSTLAAVSCLSQHFRLEMSRRWSSSSSVSRSSLFPSSFSKRPAMYLSRWSGHNEDRWETQTSSTNARQA